MVIRFLILMALFSPYLVAAQGIQFDQKSSWEGILQQAKAEKKFIFLDCFATWCGPCKKMDAEVLSLPEAGAYFNSSTGKRFINVKVQFDETSNDNAYVRSWHADAKRIKEKYGINGYPTYLFISPDGELLYRMKGFKPVKDFIAEANIATDPENIRMVQLLADYNAGKKDYISMTRLHLHVKKVMMDNVLAEKIAIDFKVNYLDKQPAERLCEKEYINFLASTILQDFVQPGNRYFDVFFKQRECVDKVQDGLAERMVRYAIEWGDVRKVLWKNKNADPVTENPDWDGIVARMTRAYGERYTMEILPDVKEEFLLKTANWKAYIVHVDQKLAAWEAGKTFGNRTLSSRPWDINMAALNLFQQSNDEKQLKKALQYADTAIKLYGERLNAQSYNTKANLLYKLGHTDEAIRLAEKAVSICFEQAKEREKTPYCNEFTEALRKMKAGVPTWKTKTDKARG